MKANKNTRISDLSIDVVEYMFIEWLSRRGLLFEYRANYESLHPNCQSFRGSLRAQFRYLSDSPVLGVGSIITMSFPFDKTPQGYDFWKNQSKLWQCFCSKFESIF